MATNTTNTSALNASGVTPKKKTSKRRMKKQVRRTLGALFLASAIAVAAIPVEPTRAGTDADGVVSHSIDNNIEHIVRSLNYKDDGSFEIVNGQIEGQPGTLADSSWHSKVPYVKATEPIYIDESLTYQFAFYTDDKNDNYAVILGARSSAIDGQGSLVLPDKVDAFFSYVSNTSSGRYSYCAVNKKGDFLYYRTRAQITDEDGRGSYHFSYYKAITGTNDPNPPTDANNSFGGLEGTLTNVDEVFADLTTMTARTADGTQSFALGEDPDSGALSYVQNYREWKSTGISVNQVDDGTGTLVDVTTYEGTWEDKTKYYPLAENNEDTYLPCYLDTKDDKWSPNGMDVELFYLDDKGDNDPDNDEYISVDAMGGDEYKRVYEVDVRYIGMQTAVDSGNNDGKWKVTEPTTSITTGADGKSVVTVKEQNGVFYNNGNLRSLTIGPNLAGIGDYAFYNCTALASITLSNQLDTIGNGAFMGCNNLKTINLDPWSNLSMIGASAFEGCAGLKTFDVPVHVSAIGDRAFKDCTSLTNIYMCGEHSNDTDVNMSLRTIGYNAFYNDSSLQYLEFPSSLSQKVPIHFLYGCTGLKYIKSNNVDFDLIDGNQYFDDKYGAESATYSAALGGGDYWKYGEYVNFDDYKYKEMAHFHHYTDTYGGLAWSCDIDDWLAMLEDENFYFESKNQDYLHTTAKDHSAAFLYDDTSFAGDYEIVVRCDEIPSHENTFVVDTNNNLVNASIDPECHILTIPSTIGGYGVSNIAAGSFSNNCSLEKLYIPYSVNSIASGAFRGCHNLNTVFFTEPYNYGLQIGDGAFDTQDGVSMHQNGCPTAPSLADTPELSFVGAIDGTYAPFAYAMSGDNNINIGNQPTTYITYYSGWPDFLEVQYNPSREDGEHIELQKYPTRSYLNGMEAQCRAYSTKYDTYMTKYEAYTNAVKNSADPDNDPNVAAAKTEMDAAAQEVNDALRSVNDKYPFLSVDNFNDLIAVFDKVGTADGSGHIITWSDIAEGKVPGMTQDQVICASSIFDLNVPYGVQSIKTGLISNINPDGKIVSDPDKEFDPTVDYQTGDYCSYSGQKYTFINDHSAGAWVPSDVALLTGVNELGANSDLRFIEYNSVKNVEPYSLAGLQSLASFDMTGGASIGDYAFFGDTKLDDVSVSGELTTIGIRPFRDCPSLLSVDFSGNNFVCEDAIIYGLSSGSKDKIIECLETRGENFAGQFNGGTTVSADELATITSIQEEAFMNCDHVEAIELSKSSISNVPERAFAGTDDLWMVTFPDTLKTIRKDAFLDSNVRQVSIPFVNTQIQDEYVFGQTENGWLKAATYDEFLAGYVNPDHSLVANDDFLIDTISRLPNRTTPSNDVDKYNPYIQNSKVDRNITFFTPEDSAASIYADDHPYITSTATAILYKVTFKDPKITGDDKTYWTTEVASGECSENPPKGNPTHDGTTFTGWLSSADGEVHTDVSTVPITGTTNYTAQYEGGNCTVTFYDKDNNIIKTQEVAYGQAVSPPSAPQVDGYQFVEWKRYPITSETGFENIITDTTFTAYYEKIDSSDKHHVVFYNYDDSIVSEQYIADGEAAQTPANPSREGYTFTGWKPADFTNITKDTDIYAQFEKNASGGGGGGGGGSSSGNSGGGSGSKSSSGNSSSGNSSKAKTYTVTVINGSGSGTYEEGSTVVIAANTPATGKAFDKWTTADVTLVSTTLSATSFKMPGKNVTVTANYKDDKSSSSGTVKYATGNSGRPPATGRTATGTTQVQVNKGGVSNVDLASATVRGSTDSFIVKVTETNEATNLVENALNNRFGGLDALKYWPCDISLYDSTGNTKITDTTGLTVEITLPIPDELRQYGGNNKVAAVSNGQLEDLGTRFNTVNGTPTVTFTATHFSPYVIYADTNNLVASEMLDASPKTGDPIHPKWFLAIALAAGSVFMFLKKDKKTAVATA